MTGTILISVVVPTFNGGDLVVRCLKSVMEQGLEALEVILVDNGSDDGSVEHAGRLCPDTKILTSGENAGFAAACNRGAAIASGEHLLFLNDDVELGTGCLETLSAAAKESSFRILAPVCRRVDGTLDSAGKAITDWGFLIAHRPGSEGIEPIFAADGACMLIEASCFRLLGGFRSSYFAYFEDIDLCWRARMAGIQVGLVTQATATHQGQATTRRVLTPQKAAFLSYRNRLRTVIANPSVSRLASMLPLQVLGMSLAAVAFAVRGQAGEAAGVLGALLWPMAHPAAAIAQRRSAQRERTVTDSSVFQPGLVERITLTAAARLLRGSLRRWKQWPEAGDPAGR